MRPARRAEQALAVRVFVWGLGLLPVAMACGSHPKAVAPATAGVAPDGGGSVDGGVVSGEAAASGEGSAPSAMAVTLDEGGTGGAGRNAIDGGSGLDGGTNAAAGADAGTGHDGGAPVQSRPLHARIAQCCDDLAALGVRLGVTPEGVMVGALSNQCRLAAQKMAQSATSAEVRQLREILRAVTVPRSCQSL
jgi:hypothetical protein